MFLTIENKENKTKQSHKETNKNKTKYKTKIQNINKNKRKKNKVKTKSTTELNSIHSKEQHNIDQKVGWFPFLGRMGSTASYKSPAVYSY